MRIGDQDGTAGRAAAIEQALTSMWMSVLGVDSVGPDDDFADLGGHSLLAMSLCARINAEFPVDLDSYDIAQWPTVAEQRALILQRLGGPAAATAATSPGPA